MTEKPKFPNCEEYGLYKWYDRRYFHGDMRANLREIHEINEQALIKAKRAGELTGMRNQHEIEKERVVELEAKLKTAEKKLKGYYKADIEIRRRLG